MDKAKRKHSFSDRTFELQMQSAPPPLRSRDLLLGSLCEKCSRQDGHITNPTGNLDNTFMKQSVGTPLSGQNP